jgi:hypothetical protein
MTQLWIGLSVLVGGLLLVFADVVFALVFVATHGAFDADRSGPQVLVACGPYVWVTVWPLVVVLAVRARQTGVRSAVVRAVAATALTVFGSVVCVGPLAESWWAVPDPLRAVGGRPLAALAHGVLAVVGLHVLRVGARPT